MKKYTLLLLFLFSLIIPKEVYAADSTFITNSYQVDMNINEDNSYDVTEDIQLDFVKPAHGFIRYIPYELRSKLRYDKKTYNIDKSTHIYDVDIKGDSFSESRSDGNLVLKIGNKNKFVSGPKDYVISYKQYVGALNLGADSDFFYYNVKPPFWATDVNNFSFKLVFPKKVDKSSIHLYSGNGIGATDNEYIDYNVYDYNDKTYVEGSTSYLPYGSTVTVFATMPKGYFSKANILEYKSGILFILVSVFILIISIYLFIRYGKDPKITRVVEFYPPDNLPPSDMGVILGNSISQKDMTANIVYLASLGYLKIHVDETEEKKLILLKKKSIKLSLIKQSKDITKLPPYLKSLYQNLFKNGGVLDVDKDTETLTDAYEALSTQILDRDDFGIVDTKSKIYKYLGFTTVLAVEIVLSALFSVFFFVPNAIFIGIIFLVISIISFIILSIGISRKEVGPVFYGFSNIIFFALNIPAWFFYSDNKLMLVGAILLSISIFIIAYLGRITDDGARLIGRILGFKDFLNIAEVDRIKTLVKDNPSYFFNILPYTYIFGLNDVWMSKLNDEIIDSIGDNTYFEGINTFDVVYTGMILNKFNNTMSNISITKGENLSNFNSGSFSSMSSGGFGGGGFGGGGSSSW